MSQNFLLFGGSFDPPHNGHLHIVREALKQLPSMKKVLFIPSFLSPGKNPPIASEADREYFLNLALDGTGFSVSNVDLVRRGPSYTVDTLHCLKADFPLANFFWLLGNDTYS